MVRRLALMWIAFFSLSLAGWSQGMMMRPPDIPGKFNLVVGSGAVYEFTAQGGQPHNFEIAVVGKESVEGKDAYWVETRVNAERGRVVVKELKVLSASGSETKRKIIQMAGQPPMEVPVNMMGMMGGAPPAQAGHASHDLGQMLGSESVTVPAGIFQCEHYRGTSEGKTSDVWLSGKVTPWGLVKVASSNSTGTLQKVLENEKSQIQGEPQKMQFPGISR